ncbi:MAG: hypothetical protein R3D62_14885 [Xanthobacteraceae bacterium]
MIAVRDMTLDFLGSKTTLLARLERSSTLGTFCVNLAADRIHPDQTSLRGIKPVICRCGEPPCDPVAIAPESPRRRMMDSLRIRQLDLIKAQLGQLASSSPTPIDCNPKKIGCRIRNFPGLAGIVEPRRA